MSQDGLADWDTQPAKEEEAGFDKTFVRKDFVGIATTAPTRTESTSD